MAADIEINLLKAAPAAMHAPALFGIVRNESYFLPHFFAHYRTLGVGFFLIYDDHSDDGSLEFLLAQPDCSVITSDRRYGEDFGMDRNGAPRRLGQALKESIPPHTLPNRWVLTADADEFLVLPEGFGDLPAFIRHLEAIGQPYATTPMVDFYGETLNHRNHGRDINPFAANPYFDVGPYYDWSDRLVPQSLVAGLRFRLMFAFHDRHNEAFRQIFPGSITSAANWKAPLLKIGSGVDRVGDHTLSIAPSTAVGAALAHFKFYPDLDAKIATALSERQYANASLEYVFLDTAIRLMGDDPLIGPETRRFTGPASLAAANLLSG